MIRLCSFALALCLLAAAPATAGGCARFDSPDWTGADAYDAREAAELMRAIVGHAEGMVPVDAPTVEIPPADELHAVIVGDQVLIIRSAFGMVCPDPPIPRAAYEAARRKVRGNDG